MNWMYRRVEQKKTRWKIIIRTRETSIWKSGAILSGPPNTYVLDNEPCLFATLFRVDHSEFLPWPGSQLVFANSDSDQSKQCELSFVKHIFYLALFAARMSNPFELRSGEMLIHSCSFICQTAVRALWGRKIFVRKYFDSHRDNTWKLCTIRIKND